MTDEKQEGISAGGASDPFPIQNVDLKSAQVTTGGSFDGSLDLEVSNNGTDWATHKTGISGLVEIDVSADFARVNDTSGTTGSFSVYWSRLKT